MLIKGIAFFQSPFGPGWSETYWSDQSDLQAGSLSLSSMVDTRLSLLRSGYTCVFAKVSQAGASDRKVITLDMSVPRVGTYTPTISPAEPADDAVAILLRLTDTLGHFNLRFIHGNGNWNVSGDSLLIEAAWQTALDGWIAAYKATYLIVESFTHGVPSENFAVNDIVVERVTIRKVGRPFAAPRGRRTIVV